MELEQPKRILVYQTAYLGDVILAVPFLRALRKTLRVTRLGLVVREGLKPLIESLGIVDEVLEVNKKDRTSRQRHKAQARNFRADVVISPHRSFRTATWVFQSGAGTRVGFKDVWSFFAYNKRVARDNSLHDVLRQASLLKAFDVEIKSEIPGDLSVRKNGGEWQKIDAFISLPDTFEFPLSAGYSTLREARQAGFKPVVMAPGSQWKTKQWTLEGFILVAQHMIKQGKKVVLVGSSAEAKICSEIADKVQGVTNLAGKTSLTELVGLVSQAEVVFCNDSGPLHIAGLTGRPAVAVFGPTIPAQGYAPWNTRGKIVQAEVKCRPCGAHGHEACPIGTHECMTSVRAESVIAASNELLQA